MQHIGIDFGTTNTVLAFVDEAGVSQVQKFHHGGSDFEAFRTALSFRRNPGSAREPECEAGPWAIERFIEAPEDTRFLQSFKSFAASPAFSDTAVFSRRFRFEDLLAAFIDKVRVHTGLSKLPDRLVVGRPVTFAGHNPDDALAVRRYDAAFKALGFTSVNYVYEPVAAAQFYAQRLTGASTILVGDFGGGTSDFSVVRFEKAEGGTTAKALGHSGIGIAGDTFDYRIIDAIVSPRLGKNATYRSWGKDLPIPVHYFTNFSRWNELCLMDRPDVIRDLRNYAQSSPQRDQLLRFIDLIEGGASYELYRTVSQVKAQLSSQDEARFKFNSSGVRIEETIRRADLENWIADDLLRIDQCVDRVMTQTGLDPRHIDRVFLTGGTSYVPSVRRLFDRRFGLDRIDTGDQLVSIAKGLALIGAGNDITRWTAP